MLAARLAATCTVERLDLDLPVVLEAVPLDAVVVEGIRASALQKVLGIQALARALSSPEDLEQLYKSLAALWLELRFEWERHNTVSNFTLALSGEVDAPTMVKGATASMLLGWLETLLDPHDTEQLVAETCRMIDSLRPEIEDGTLVPMAQGRS